MQAFLYTSRVRRFAKGHWIERGGRGKAVTKCASRKNRNEDRTSTFGKVIFPKGNSREEPRVEGSGAQGRASMHYLLAAGFIRSQVTD